MNFLKISGLIFGTGSVVGGTGAGIYYVANRKNTEEEKPKIEASQKTQFEGKLVFEKKENDNYEFKLFTTQQYIEKEKEFNESKSIDNEKYGSVNKVIEISHALKFSELETKLKEIFSNEITLADAKSKITSEATKLKELFDDDIYAKLKTALGA